MLKRISLQGTNTWIYLLSFLFIFLNVYLISKEFYYFSLLPLAFLMALIAIYRLDILVYLIVFLTPISISLSEFIESSDIDMHLPTEPLLFGVMLIFFTKILFEKRFDKRILLHPVSLAIYLNLAWILVTCVISTDPLVSFKFLIARMWFLVTFFFIATQLFRQTTNIKKYIFLFIIPLFFVVLVTIYKHSKLGFFNMKASHFVVNPFFKDHTSYGAILALLLPVIFGFFYINRKKDILKQIPLWIFGIVFSAALILSYTRAAWLSLVVAAIIAFIIILKIKVRTVFWFTLLIAAFLYSIRIEIAQKLEKNKQESSSDLLEHVHSMSNIASDASNMERINRWNSALRMFRERPVFGFGPGTYMFEYAPYQISYEKTIISTNFGDLGNAHSEYIGPLAESGILGSLSFVLIVVLVIFTALRVYKNAPDENIKVLSLVLLLGLITYYTHGFLNNFLDTDKASALFWGFSAMLVAMDVYHVKRSLLNELPNEPGKN